MVYPRKKARDLVELGSIEHQHIQVVCGTDRRRSRFSGKKRYLSQRAAGSDAVHRLLDAGTIDDQDLRRPGLDDVDLV